MNSKWPTVKLGEVLRRSEDTIEPITDTEYREITVRLWGKGVVERRRAVGAALSGRRFVAHTGQFIASRIDARNGAMGLVPASLDGALVTNDFPLFNLNTARLESAFLGWICRMSGFVELCLRASEGTTNRVRLKEDRFLALEVPLPQIAEQRRIVAKIEELAAKIQEARNLREQAMDESKDLQMILAAQTLDRLTEDYPVRTLAEVVTIRGGGTPAKADPSYWSGSIPWITPKDMKRRELSDAIDHISELATRNTAAKQIAPNAVLVVVRGMILVHTFPSAVLRASAAINQDMKALIPTDELLPEYLCAAFWAYNSRLLALVEKSSHDTRKLETDKLLGSTIAVPPIPHQRRIIAELGALEAKAQTLKRFQTATAAELDALLPSVLSNAFAGEL